MNQPGKAADSKRVVPSPGLSRRKKMKRVSSVLSMSFLMSASYNRQGEKQGSGWDGTPSPLGDGSNGTPRSPPAAARAQCRSSHTTCRVGNP